MCIYGWAKQSWILYNDMQLFDIYMYFSALQNSLTSQLQIAWKGRIIITKGNGRQEKDKNVDITQTRNKILADKKETGVYTFGAPLGNKRSWCLLCGRVPQVCAQPCNSWEPRVHEWISVPKGDITRCQCFTGCPPAVIKSACDATLRESKGVIWSCCALWLHLQDP